MFLSRSAIERAVASGAVTIDPFDPTRFTGASYVFGVGDEMLEVAPQADGAGFTFSPRAVLLEDGAWSLQPGRLYLAATDARIGSNAYAMRLVGRPALGHTGLFLQISADLGHQGACHAWTLEIIATRPTRLAPFQKIGQVAFCRTLGAPAPYAGAFAATDRPAMSPLHAPRDAPSQARS
ncbi:MAG: deoxycytidine deaminase [Alphaproteobacteria bacterium]|nr:deoxycytidine deaminase [Alphaproteobacteria bacterium]